MDILYRNMYKRDIFDRSRYILTVWKYFLYFEFSSVFFLQNTSTYFYSSMLYAEYEKREGANKEKQICYC